MKRYISVFLAVFCCLFFSSCDDDNRIEIPTPETVEIKLSETLVTLDPGGTVTLKALNVKDVSIVEEVVWISLDESVATVSKGLVKALAGGTAIIRAVAVAGGSTAECKVLVNAPLPPSDIDFGGAGDIEDFH